MKYDFIPDSVSEHTNVYDVLKERGFIEQSTDEEKVRELLGSGAVFGHSFGTGDYMPLVFVLAPGGFFVLGYLMVVFNKLAKK